MTPPPLVELVLSAIIADDRTREAVLGDLVEEWTTRAADAGERSADVWYLREAIRTAPALMADSLRQCPSWTIPAALVAIVALRLASGLLGFMTAIVVVRLSEVIGFDPWTSTALGAAASAAWTFLAMCLVVRWVRRAPLALMFWFTLAVVVGTIGPLQIAGGTEYVPWFMLMEKLMSVAAAVGGGLFALAVRRSTQSRC